MIPPFRQGSRSNTDMAAESPQTLLLLAVLVLGVFGKAVIAFIFSFAKFRKDSRSDEIVFSIEQNVEAVKLKPKQNICSDCGVSKNLLLR